MRGFFCLEFRQAADIGSTPHRRTLRTTVEMTQLNPIDARLMDWMRSLLGRRCEHEGKVWRLIDILPGEGLLVLESDLEYPPIQMDQYGRASHRANSILQIPILDPVTGGLGLEARDLLDCLQST
jgi:hypothetical protein